MNTDPVTLTILVLLVANTLLRVRTYRIEKRRLRFERTRRAINKSDLSQLILEGDRARVRSLGIEVGR